jgi:hypothetical protein
MDRPFFERLLVMVEAEQILLRRVTILWVVRCVQSDLKCVLELRVEEVDADGVGDCLGTWTLLVSDL